MIQICESDGGLDVPAVGNSAVILSGRDVAAAAGGVLEAGIARRSFQTGIHEASHATVSRLLGLPVVGATIEFFDGHFGATWADDAGLLAGGETVENICRQLAPLLSDTGSRADIAIELLYAGDQVISLLAGPIAEELFCAERLPGSEHDEAEATCIARLICRSPASIDAYLEFARVEVVALLSDHRAVVLAVADALVKHRTINGEQIDGIIRGAQLLPLSGHWPFPLLRVERTCG